MILLLQLLHDELLPPCLAHVGGRRVETCKKTVIIMEDQTCSHAIFKMLHSRLNAYHADWSPESLNVKNGVPESIDGLLVCHANKDEEILAMATQNPLLF